MSLSEIKLENNRKMLQKFIYNQPIDPAYQLPFDAKVFGCIYCILNTVNKKRYIGATYAIWAGTVHEDPITQIKKRATDYLYEYNKASSGTETSRKTLRPIIKAMVKEGFDKFIIYPICETIKENHYELEKYFIDLYNTTNPDFGYNVTRGGNGIRKIGNKMTAKYKRSRSDPIICININDKKIIFSESMKLFGDFMNIGKDMIKNANRSALPYKGWFIFYIDKDKRNFILNAQYNPTFNKTRNHSEKALAFYRGLYESVSQLIDCKNNEYFSDFEILPELKYVD